MVSGVLESAGIVRLGELINKAGKVDFESLKEKFIRNKVRFKSRYVRMIVCKMVGVATSRWGRLFKQRPPDPGKCFNFALTSDRGARRALTELTTKHFYKVLLERIVRRPSAEHIWTRTFPASGPTFSIVIRHPH